jgi:aryl-alcohol dehydrogenase-like predicted oxidoreductase
MSITRREAIAGLAGAAALGGARSALGAQDEQAAAHAPPPAVMRKRIPKTGEWLPAIGMGTSRTFDVDPSGDLTAQVEVTRAFLDAGGSVIDSSPMYGSSEQVVGRALDQLGRHDYFSATKVWTAEGRNAGITQMTTSMRMMRAEPMDLMQVHNLVGYDDHMPTLREWKKSGKIRHIGITEMRDMDRVVRLMETADLDFIQIPYSVDDRRVEERVLPAAQATGTGVLVMTPFGRGRLFTVTRGQALPAWAAEIGAASWAQVFLKWLLAHPAVTCPIPATSKPHHMVDNMGAGHGALPDEALRARIARELDAM